MTKVRLHAPTPGTRIAIWIFPGVTLWLGLSYLGPLSRLQAAAYTAASAVVPDWVPGAPMRLWGVVFVALAAFKICAILRGTTHAYVIAMCAGMGLYTWWAFLFTCSIWADPHTSLAAPVWPLSFVFVHVATLATMMDKERV